MKLIDVYGMPYYLLKKNGEYYLATKHIKEKTKKEHYRVEVKGLHNIQTYIRNNGLIEYKEVIKSE